MAMPKRCERCERVTTQRVKRALADGWRVTRVGDQELWLCPTCAKGGT